MRIVLLAVLLVACADVTAVAEAEDVRVERSGDELLITNGRDIPIYWFAVGENVAAVIDWIPCVTGPGCPSVAPQSIERVPLASIAGGGEDVILFYWWRAEPGPTGPVPGSVRMLRID